MSLFKLPKRIASQGGPSIVHSENITICYICSQSWKLSLRSIRNELAENKTEKSHHVFRVYTQQIITTKLILNDRIVPNSLNAVHVCTLGTHDFILASAEKSYSCEMKVKSCMFVDFRRFLELHAQISKSRQTNKSAKWWKTFCSRPWT